MLNGLNLFFGLGGLLTPWMTANVLGGNPLGMCYLKAPLGAVTRIVNIATPMLRPTGERGFKASKIKRLSAAQRCIFWR